MAETESLINSAQTRAGGLAIEAQMPALEAAGVLNGPLEHGIGNHAAGEFSANGQTMDKGRFLLLNVRPEQLVSELKLYRSRRLKVRFREMEKTRADVVGDF
jgi:hypothetical protein